VNGAPVSGGDSRRPAAFLSNPRRISRRIVKRIAPGDEDDPVALDEGSLMPDWIERADAELVAQAKVFSAGISADPGAFGATPLQAAELAERAAAFSAAYYVTLQSWADSTTATLVKSETRALLVESMRARARTIRAMTSVSAEQKINLEMSIPNPRRTRVPAPDDVPQVQLGPPDGRRIPVRVRSTLTPATRGLPRDVASVQVFAATGDSFPPLSDIGTRWRPLGTFSRSHFDVEYNFADAKSGETLWIVARYANARSQVGKWSNAPYTYVVGPAMRFAGDANLTASAA
jgi:hypothetical protein